jgi:riboflavin synthase
MFTGIVEEVGRVLSVEGHSITIGSRKVIEKAELGSSIAVNGTCLTVTHLDKSGFSVDVMEETLERTNLGDLKTGDAVNLEGALTLSKGLGGHLVEGHVDTVGQVKAVVRKDNSTMVEIQAPASLMRYIVEKGFVTVNGTSLTVVKRTIDTFSVSLVGFTVQNTNLGSVKPGDKLNLEADIIAKYVERYVAGNKTGISEDFLKENGFI